MSEISMECLERHPHVRCCLLCKSILDQSALQEEEEYVARGLNVILRHIEAVPKPAGIACRYAECIHHESIPHDLARAMIKVGHGDKPWKDIHGVKVSNIPLVVTSTDAPEGWDRSGQDILDRYFENMPPEAGNIFVRFNTARVRIHLWVSPQYKSRHEDITDVPTIEDLVETHEKRVPEFRSWCLERYAETRMLAGMELEFRKRPAKRRRKGSQDG